jgi:DNA-directed RNA polymerases I, II, and III subunit RPABC2
MSDNEYYSNESDNESVISSDDEVTNKKKPLINKGIAIKKGSLNNHLTIKDYDDDDDDDEKNSDDEFQEGEVANNSEEEDKNDGEHQEGEQSDEDYEDGDEEEPDPEGEEDDDMDGDQLEKEEKIKKNKATKKTNVPVIIDSDDEEDDDMDENYLQKFDSEINKNYINEFHPECLLHNYEEIEHLTKVVRDENNNIIDPLHKTIPFLTKYERARILGQRAKQIECGAKPFVKVPENIIDSYIIADLELKQKRIPFIIRRPIPGGGSEYWNLMDLENIAF